MQPKTQTAVILLIVVAAIAALAVVFVTSSQQQAALQSVNPPAPIVGSNLEGEAFMQQNAQEPGVTTTASGLQYRVDRLGDGALPASNSEVTVHYRGTLLNGTVFDSSYERGEPISFFLTGVIAGWQEGLQLMPVGSQYTFWIPGDLAYGQRGIPGTIPPNATLVFQVELLEIN